MKFVVTGGAGFIGSHLTNALLPRGTVIVLDDLSTGTTQNLDSCIENPHLEFILGSVTDIALLREVFTGAHCIFHQAAIPSVQRSIDDPVRTNRVNVEGTLNVLIAARDTGVRKVILASSSSIYGDTPVLPKHEELPPHPLSPYAVSKLAGEAYSCVFAELFDIQTVCLRYFNVYGPRQDPTSDYAAVIPRFIVQTLASQPVTVYGDGDQTRDFTFVKDVVQANICAMESSVSGVFNIAHGTRISVNDLADRIMAIAGIHTGIIHEDARKGDVRDSLANISRARQAFGFVPRYTIEKGLTETIHWFQSRQ